MSECVLLFFVEMQHISFGKLAEKFRFGLILVCQEVQSSAVTLCFECFDRFLVRKSFYCSAMLFQFKQKLVKVGYGASPVLF